MIDAFRSFLRLREGELRPLVLLGLYMFLLTATTTLLLAAKNGLFLSVYDAKYIPLSMILGAIVTAVVSVAFSGFAARARSRDGLAGGFLQAITISLLFCWIAFAVEPRSAFVIYLWLETCGVLLLIQAWSYVGDSVTSRQAKRLMPLIGIGGSVASIGTGLAVGPLAPLMGTNNLLLLAGGLVWSATALLGRVETPEEEGLESVAVEIEAEPGLKGFVRSSGRGFKIIRQEPLLKLVAAALVFVMATSTLIDFQFKLAVQSRFGADDIAAFYGYLSGAVGAAALILQLSASRVIFPKFGISAAAMGHAGTLALNAGVVATIGGLPMLFILQVLDDSLRFSIERPAEQVSLLPFPRRVKGPAYTTIGGVLRPLAAALTATAAIFLARRPALLPIATAVVASAAMLLYTRHRGLYLTALEDALARRSVDFGTENEVQLVVDRTALSVIDRALADREPGVVVFAISLLSRMPRADALPRILPLLDHPAKEVRSEAASALGTLDEAELGPVAQRRVLERLGVEDAPMTLAALLRSMERWSGPHVDARIAEFLEHSSVEVKRAALLTLGLRAWDGTHRQVDEMFASERPDVRSAAASVVGALELTEFLAVLAVEARHARVRPAALEALGKMGYHAIDVLGEIIDDADAELPLRRSALSTLAEIDDGRSRERLLAAVRSDELRATALRTLRRLRESESLRAMDADDIRPLLVRECGRGLRYALASTVLQADEHERARRVAVELARVRDECARRTMEILALHYPVDRIRAVEAGLLSDAPERRSSALELLDGMLERGHTQLVMPLCEGIVEGSGGAAARPGSEEEDLGSDVLGMLRMETDWWIRALAIYALAAVDPDSLDEEDREMIPLIEKVMILKGSELFKAFPGEELAGVAALAREVHLDEDEVLFEEGEPGDAFYMVVQGAIRISREGRELAVLGPREGFGEMAILDHETRSATASAAERTTLLSIDQHSFDALVDRNPSVARGIYRMLSRRLRNTLAQVARA